MKIDIVITSYIKNYSIYANKKTKEFIIDGQKLPFSKDFFKRAINIVKKWPDLLEESGVTDGITYKIVYGKAKHEKVLLGNNDVPEDFYELITLIRKFYPKTRKELIEEEIELRGLEQF